ANSPRLGTVEVLKRGRVRRAKLYYIRGRRGKSARIQDIVDTTETAQSAAK
ncbi:MAG TPA: 50S ribosomal protein L19, partial [bacterium]|nr:50S ribosomal protein L19 [bacterium]